MSQVIVSAPGKVHLMGEHAVVHGKPALLAAINVRLMVKVDEADHGLEIAIDSSEGREFIQYAVEIIQQEYSIDTLPPMKISVDSAIPFGYHLGSSAALAVATVGAVVFFVKKLWNPSEINRLAYEVEKKQHGNPSGGDNTSVTFGGFLWYRRELEFLKSIWQIPLTLPASLNHFVLLNTGKPEETTGEMVTSVGEKVKAEKSYMDDVFLRNEEATRAVAKAIKESDETLLIQSMQKGEKTLEEMGVVSDSVLSCIRAVENAGGAAKILGGGGKKGAVGFILAYHPDIQVVASIAQEYKYPLQAVLLGEEGVKLESGRKTS